MTGAVLATAYGLYAWSIGMGSDGALAWNFMYLPLILGLAAAVLTLLRPTRPVVHVAAFALAAAVGYRLFEEALIAGLGESAMKRTEDQMLEMIVWTFVPTFIVGSVATAIGSLATRRRRGRTA